MIARLIAFTAAGLATAHRAAKALQEAGWQVQLSAGFGEQKQNLAEWTGNAFRQAQAVIFVGATGIAVRAAAPFLQEKAKDPALISMDEQARFCIPLASGHLGGANRLALYLAEQLGSVPVITTATDLNGVFAVDSWAASQGFIVADPRAIKRISGRLLAGGQVGFYSQLPVSGPMPAGLYWAERKNCQLALAYQTQDLPADVLLLVPRCLTLGIGCRRGATADQIEAAFLDLCGTEKIHPLAVGCVASVDKKADETGILAFCAARRLPFECYPSALLEQLKGDFSDSAFVRRTVGTGCVCERAACAEGAALLTKKKSFAGKVTLALAKKDKTAFFDAAPFDGGREQT